MFLGLHFVGQRLQMLYLGSAGATLPVWGLQALMLLLPWGSHCISPSMSVLAVLSAISTSWSSHAPFSWCWCVLGLPYHSLMPSSVCCLSVWDLKSQRSLALLFSTTCGGKSHQDLGTSGRVRGLVLPWWFPFLLLICMYIYIYIWYCSGKIYWPVS